MNYYQEELANLSPFLKGEMSFKLKGYNIHGEHVETKWLLVTTESIEALMETLKGVKNE